ncbi:MAG: tRNA (guanosine(46)-N7)-methyltransferase TrmB [Bacilli bacterium]
MRLRNIKGSKEIIEQSNYVIKNPFEYIGKFNNQFRNNNPIYIEIGMGKGNFIIENARRYQNINFIGIEKYDSVMIRALEKLNNEKLDNLKLIRIDAKDINKIFDKEIDLIYLNFSDPWPKDRHFKRRLTSTDFLERYDKIFKEKKHIIMKTDNRKLFEFSIMSFTSNNYKINEIFLDLYKDDITDNIPTEYEIKFSNQGYPIYKIDVEK